MIFLLCSGKREIAVALLEEGLSLQYRFISKFYESVDIFHFKRADLELKVFQVYTGTDVNSIIIAEKRGKSKKLVLIYLKKQGIK